MTSLRTNAGRDDPRARTGLVELVDYIEHFQKRVVQDALTEASAGYWRGRADRFEAAMPRAGDFTGQATEADLLTQRDRLEQTATACRARAEVSLLGGTR